MEKGAITEYSFIAFESQLYRISLPAYQLGYSKVIWNFKYFSKLIKWSVECHIQRRPIRHNAGKIMFNLILFVEM